jgi:hypothetical protein
VFGINIGIDQAVPSFHEADFRQRITTMLQVMHINGSIDLAQDLKRAADYHSVYIDFGSVRISVENK